MRCPACETEIEDRDAWFCPACDHILDLSVLAKELLPRSRAESELAAVVDAFESSYEVAPEAVIVGDLDDEADEDDDPSEASMIPGAAMKDGKVAGLLLYASKHTSRALQPSAVPVVANRDVTFPNTPIENFVLACVDGRRTIREIQRASGIASHEITAAVLTLLDKGLIAILPEPPPPDDDDLESTKEGSVPAKAVAKVSDEFTEEVHTVRTFAPLSATPSIRPKIIDPIATVSEREDYEAPENELTQFDTDSEVDSFEPLTMVPDDAFESIDGDWDASRGASKTIPPLGPVAEVPRSKLPELAEPFDKTPPPALTRSERGSKLPSRPAAKVGSSASSKPDLKPDAKPDLKPDAKPSTKPEPSAKIEPKVSSKPAPVDDRTAKAPSPVRPPPLPVVAPLAPLSSAPKSDAPMVLADHYLLELGSVPPGASSSTSGSRPRLELKEPPPLEVTRDTPALPVRAFSERKEPRTVAADRAPISVRAPTAAPELPEQRPPTRGADGDLAYRGRKLFEQALQDRADGDLVSAQMNVKLAITFDPNEPKYGAVLEELKREAAAPGAKKGPVKKSLASELYDKATECEAAGDIDQAIEYLEKALRQSKEPAFYNRLGVILAMRKREYDRGREMIEKALDLAPNNSTYKHNLGKILARAAEAGLDGRSKKDSGKRSGGGFLGLFGKKK